MSSPPHVPMRVSGPAGPGMSGLSAWAAVASDRALASTARTRTVMRFAERVIGSPRGVVGAGTGVVLARVGLAPRHLDGRGGRAQRGLVGDVRRGEHRPAGV